MGSHSEFLSRREAGHTEAGCWEQDTLWRGNQSRWAALPKTSVLVWLQRDPGPPQAAHQGGGTSAPRPGVIQGRGPGGLLGGNWEGREGTSSPADSGRPGVLCRDVGWFPVKPALSYRTGNADGTSERRESSYRFSGGLFSFPLAHSPACHPPREPRYVILQRHPLILATCPALASPGIILTLMTAGA